MQVSPDDTSEEHLYRKMKTTQGGVMLLVRLHADLSTMSIDSLRMLRTLDAHAKPQEVFETGSRLRSTYEWLEDKFGRFSAVRAVIESAGDVLRLVPIN